MKMLVSEKSTSSRYGKFSKNSFTRIPKENGRLRDFKITLRMHLKGNDEHFSENSFLYHSLSSGIVAGAAKMSRSTLKKKACLSVSGMEVLITSDQMLTFRQKFKFPNIIPQFILRHFGVAKNCCPIINLFAIIIISY
jgi:hypothetical protein